MIVLLAFVYVSGVFLGSGAMYVAGRILLPEMGLTAPAYWPWFWAAAIVAAIYGLITFIVGWIGEL